MKKLAIALALAVAVTGCTRTEIVKPSDDKLECPNEPPAPPRNGPNGRVTDDDARAYMTKLRGAWQGCRSDVDWLRDWFSALPG